jgi:hypothetical protein
MLLTKYHVNTTDAKFLNICKQPCADKQMSQNQPFCQQQLSQQSRSNMTWLNKDWFTLLWKHNLRSLCFCHVGIFQTISSPDTVLHSNVRSPHSFKVTCVHRNACRSSCLYCCPILTKTGMWWRILVKLPNTKFYENPLCSSRGVTCEPTSRHGKDKRCCSVTSLWMCLKSMSVCYHPFTLYSGDEFIVGVPEEGQLMGKLCC